MKTFTIMCMFPAFNYETNLYTNVIFKEFEYIRDNKEENIDIYLLGSFITDEDYLFIKKLENKIKILWLSEPIIYHFKNPYKLIQENKFNYIYGCVLDKVNDNRFKLPLYINYYKIFEEEEYYNKDYFKRLNNIYKISSNNEINKKLFCCLIARHDNWNTRLSLYEKIKDIDKIICPSKLLNNFDNKILNKKGKINFLKDFVFNLCPENSKYNFPGYITEKLMDSCLSGCIPIYCGKLDKIDKNIFNINRIIFYEANNKESLEKCYIKIKDLYEDKKKLMEFYNQNIFDDNAYLEFMNMINNFKNMIKLIK